MLLCLRPHPEILAKNTMRWEVLILHLSPDTAFLNKDLTLTKLWKRGVADRLANCDLLAFWSFKGTTSKCLLTETTTHLQFPLCGNAWDVFCMKLFAHGSEELNHKADPKTMNHWQEKNVVGDISCWPYLTANPIFSRNRKPQPIMLQYNPAQFVIWHEEDSSGIYETCQDYRWPRFGPCCCASRKIHVALLFSLTLKT